MDRTLSPAVIATNAKTLFDSDGDFYGYALPQVDPFNIDIKFVPGKRVDEDELVYLATWTDGTWAEMFSLPDGWHDIYLASIRKRQDAANARLDATLEQMRAPIGEAA